MSRKGSFDRENWLGYGIEASRPYSTKIIKG